MEYTFGRRPVLEVLRAGKRSIHKLWIAENTHGTEEILRLARLQGVPAEFVSRHFLDAKVQGHHQGVVAQAIAASYVELDDFLRTLPHPNPLPKGEGADRPGEAKPVVIIALDEIQDPHNIGAILRSGGFFGVSAAIVPRWRSAPVGETAARVSSGAIEHIPLIRVRNLAESINELKDAGFEVIGADMEGSPIREHQPHNRTALVFGGEGKGLRRLVRERCDKLLKVPGQGPVGSLNVAAAAAIFLYEFCRNKVGSQPT
jgi:23S rRNA (guanosine2251-2'-O)-methyltransferase